MRTLTQLESDVAAHEAAKIALSIWEARTADHAKAQPPAPGAAPTAPTGSRPTADEHRAAVETCDAAKASEGAAAQRATDRATAQAAVEEAGKAALRSTAEAARLDALVDACRRAPSSMAARQLAALGDLGPVTLAFPERENAQTPEVRVLFDGRPWYRASKGRLICADLWLRAGLRRALGVPLPLFVDEYQSWSGAWPVLDGGPVVYLRTVAGAGGLRVVAPSLPSEVA